MDLPPEYVLHLLPLMAICGIPPPQVQIQTPSEKRAEKVSGAASPRSAPILASVPYIERDLGNAILKIIDQWRTLALWEPLASKQHQIPGASLEGMFRVIPVDRVKLFLSVQANESELSTSASEGTSKWRIWNSERSRIALSIIAFNPRFSTIPRRYNDDNVDPEAQGYYPICVCIVV